MSQTLEDIKKNAHEAALKRFKEGEEARKESEAELRTAKAQERAASAPEAEVVTKTK